MKGPAYRVYREGFPHHTFTRARNGFIVFYSEEDCIFYLTLFGCLARKHKIRALSFSIMPNHCHAEEMARDKASFLAFHDELNALFAQEYNRQHHRSGPLWESPFGYAAKTVAKRIRDTICYIANNPVVGKLSKDILSFRWSLLPYYKNNHPFSEKIVLRQATRPLRRAVDRVNHFRRLNLPLTYLRQSQIFKDLQKEERNQVIDYIISKYNFLDYDMMLRFYGDSFEQASLSFRTHSGSEHEIPEDYEDYSIYVQMMGILKRRGVDLEDCNFEKLPAAQIRKWATLFREFGFLPKQIDRFLHHEHEPHCAGPGVPAHSSAGPTPPVAAK